MSSVKQIVFNMHVDVMLQEECQNVTGAAIIYIVYIRISGSKLRREEENLKGRKADAVYIH